MLRRLLMVAVIVPTVALAAGKPGSPPKLDVEYEPTPPHIVNAILDMAKVGPSDTVLDLGCGDGRIPIAAAKKYGARGIGVDLDPKRIAEARLNAEKADVVGKVEFVEGDLFKTELRGPTVITLFLWPTINIKLRPRLLDLAPGTRIVSLAHDMGDWKADEVKMIDTRLPDWGVAAVYSWVVPAKVDGTWLLKDGERELELKLTQKYQSLSGPGVETAVDFKKKLRSPSQVRGTEVTLHLRTKTGQLRRYVGHVTAEGTIDGEGWQAIRRRP